MPCFRGRSNPEAGRVSLFFDQNLSRRLPALLKADYPGSEHVVLSGLIGADDPTVWKYAAARGLAIVSKDTDFHLLSGQFGSPPKVILLRIGNGPTRDVETLLRFRKAEVVRFLNDPDCDLFELP